MFSPHFDFGFMHRGTGASTRLSSSQAACELFSHSRGRLWLHISMYDRYVASKVIFSLLFLAEDITVNYDISSRNAVHSSHFFSPQTSFRNMWLPMRFAFYSNHLFDFYFPLFHNYNIMIKVF